MRLARGWVVWGQGAGVGFLNWTHGKGWTMSPAFDLWSWRKCPGTPKGSVQWAVMRPFRAEEGFGQGWLSAHRRPPKLWEMWVGPEGKEEQGNLHRVSQGVVRNARPQLHFHPRPTEAFPWVGPWPCLLPGVLGDSELEGLGSSLVNSSSEDLKKNRKSHE